MKTATLKSALLVIDVQESFRGRPYWQAEELPAFLANTQALIDGCRERDIPVLQVFHQEPGEDVRNPFHPASGLVRAMPELKLHVTDLLKRTGTRPGHIFNLGHGILPETPVENVKAVVEMVREFRP